MRILGVIAAIIGLFFGALIVLAVSTVLSALGIYGLWVLGGLLLH